MPQAYGFAGCTTVNCPRYADIDLPVDMPKWQLLQDMRGNYWCKQCTKRCELMSYEHEHQWPEVRVQGQQGTYTTLGDYADWFTNIALGNQDMIDAMYAELIGTEEAA